MDTNRFTLSCSLARGGGGGVNMYIYIYIYESNLFELYFSNRLTFSNIRSRTSRQIYRLALLLCAPEMLSSLNNSRISIFGRAKRPPHWGVQSRFRVIGERAKRARHSQVCSIENRIYIIIYYGTCKLCSYNP